MAENEDRSRDDLSEEESPYRVEEFRKKGQVAQSREVSALLALLAAGVVTYLISPKIGTDMAGLMRELFRADTVSKLDLTGQDVLKTYMVKILIVMASVGLPVALAGFVMGILGSFAQIGSIFSTEPLTPDLKKIDPLGGLQKIFSGRNAVEAVKMIIKSVIVLWVSYVLVRNFVFQAPGTMDVEAVGQMALLGHAAKVTFLSLIGILTVFAAIDYAWQKWDFSKNLKLTKQEAKQEHKEREGDPMIKSRIRAIQREMARRRMMDAVKKATVVVTNPTHIAIALLYDKDKHAAPRVVAKGADFVAQKIKAIAAEAGVPMVENVPLARTIYKSVKIGQFIPRSLYQAVAEVLAYVYRLRAGRNPPTGL